MITIYNSTQYSNITYTVIYSIYKGRNYFSKYFSYKIEFGLPYRREIISSPESHASSFWEERQRRNVPLEFPKKCTPATRGCNSQFRQYPPERRSCGLNPRSRTLFIARPFSPRQPLLCHAAQYPRASPLTLFHFILTYPITYPVTRPGIDFPKSGSFPAGMLATPLSSPSLSPTSSYEQILIWPFAFKDKTR